MEAKRKLTSKTSYEKRQVKTYVTPNTADLIVYEYRDSNLPKNKDPKYNVDTPSFGNFPNHKLSHVADADYTGIQKWFFVADRANQDDYNFELSVGEKVTRSYLVPRDKYFQRPVGHADAIAGEFLYPPAGADSPDVRFPEFCFADDTLARGEIELDSIYVIIQRRFILPVKIEQRFDAGRKRKVTVTTTVIPATPDQTAVSVGGIVTEIKDVNAFHSLKFETQASTDDDPLISPSAEDQLYVTEESVVVAGADPDTGGGYITSKVEAIGDGNANKTTKIAVSAYDETDQSYTPGFAVKTGNTFDPRYGLAITIAKTKVEVGDPLPSPNPSVAGSVVTAVARSPYSVWHSDQETRTYTLPDNQVWYGSRRAPSLPKVLESIQVIDSITNPTLVPIFAAEVEGLLKAKWTRKFTFGQPVTGLFVGRIYRPEEFVYLTEYDRSSATTTISSGTSTSIGVNSSNSTNSGISSSDSSVETTGNNTSATTQSSNSSNSSTGTNHSDSSASGTSTGTSSGTSDSTNFTTNTSTNLGSNSHSTSHSDFSGENTSDTDGYSNSNGFSDTTNETTTDNTSSNTGHNTSNGTSDTTSNTTHSDGEGNNTSRTWSHGANESSSFTATSDDGAVVQGDPGINRYSSGWNDDSSIVITNTTGGSGSGKNSSESTSDSVSDTQSDNFGDSWSFSTGHSTSNSVTDTSNSHSHSFSSGYSDTITDTATSGDSSTTSDSTSTGTSSGTSDGTSSGTSTNDSTSNSTSDTISSGTSSGTSVTSGTGTSISNTTSNSTNTGTSDTNGSSEFTSNSASTSIGKSILSLRLPPCLHGVVTFEVLGDIQTITATVPTDIERGEWVIEDIATNHWQDGIWVTETVEIFIPAA